MSQSSARFPALVPPRFSGVARGIFVVFAAWACWFAGSVVLCASAAAAVPGPAAADVPAPMCDPMGASVAAQPDMDLPLVDRGRFEQLPCEALALMLGAHVRGALHPEQALRGDAPERPEQPAREVERTRHEGAGSFVSALPLRAEPVISDCDDSAGLAPSRGHHRSVYRPPVAGA